MSEVRLTGLDKLKAEFDGFRKKLERARGAASGYASLNSSSKVVEQPASISDFLETTPTNGEAGKTADSDWLYDHDAADTAVHGAGASTLATAADIATHAGLADPHTGYVLESLFNATTFLYAASDNTPLPKTPAQTMALLSGAAAASFSMNTQKILNVVDPTTNQGAATKKYVDDNAYTASTRSFWVFPQFASGATLGVIGDFACYLMDAANEYAHFSFGVPADFSSLTTVKLVWSGVFTGTVDWTVTTDFFADGEDYNNHSDSATADGQATTASAGDVLDISAAFTGLAAGDFVGVKFLLDAVSSGGLRLKGLEFKYAE